MKRNNHACKKSLHYHRCNATAAAASAFSLCACNNIPRRLQNNDRCISVNNLATNDPLLCIIALFLSLIDPFEQCTTKLSRARCFAIQWSDTMTSYTNNFNNNPSRK
jgi:hypothetical protein